MSSTKEHLRVVAIDGPSGSGKSTVAKELGKTLNFVYINTGAMFRALAYVFDRDGVNLKIDEDTQAELEKINLEYGKSETELVCVNGENLTDKISEHRISDLTSVIAQNQLVRDYLLEFQRNLAATRPCVMEGRDIGTIVFPEAFCKIYLTTAVGIRAQRRLKELRELGHMDHNLLEIINDIKDRDMRDIGREIAPLKKADDAEQVETGEMTIDEVVNKIKSIVFSRAEVCGIDID
jgi:CMP/dCMP kinase